MERVVGYEQFETDEDRRILLNKREVRNDSGNVRRCLICAILGVLGLVALAILAGKFKLFKYATDFGVLKESTTFPPTSQSGITNEFSESETPTPDVTISEVVAGDGQIFPVEDSFVYVHYIGTLRNGTVFDSSRKDGRAFRFIFSKESGVISGWLRGLSEMSLGERAILHVPNKLAYGERGHKKIPKGADLDFDIQVLAVDQHVWKNLNKSSILRPGDGINFPRAGDIVFINFLGYLASTKQLFEDTHKRGKPFRFAVGMDQLDFGMDFGIQKLSLGEHAVLNVPQEFGFAEKGAGPIPPNSDLIYDVELLAIQRRNPICFDECAPPPRPGPANLPLKNLTVQDGTIVDDAESVPL